MKLTVNPVTGLLELVGKGGGGGGGDGVKKINGKSPDSSGNYVIKADDIPTASETAQGGATLATSEETIAGTVTNKIVTPKTLSDKLGDQTEGKYYRGKGKDQPGEWVDLPTPPTPSFVPMPSVRFDDSIVAQVNHNHWLTDPVIVTPTPIQLPVRGQFKPNDEIEIVNLSGSSFKLFIKSGDASIIRFDNQSFTDIDGKFLLSEGNGSFVRLKAQSSQLWVVINRNRVTVSSGSMNSVTKNLVPINMYLKRNAKESFTFDGTDVEYHIRLPKFAEVGEINDITFTNEGIAQLAQRPHWAAQGEKDDYFVSPQMTVKIGDMQTTRGHNGVTYIKGPAHIKLKCTRRHLINPKSIKNRTIQYWEMDFEALEWSGDIGVK